MLEGKVAVVTGSGQSIGRAIAVALAAAGASVVVNSRREVSIDETPTAADTAREIEDAGGSAVAVFADVGTFDGANAVVDAAVETYGGVDILVNNAGGGAAVTSLLETTDDDWFATLRSNLTSQWACTRRALPHLRQRPWGRVLNIGSTSGLTGIPNMSAYSAAKGGSHGLTMALAKELAPITVNSLMPSAATVRNNRSRAEREARIGIAPAPDPYRTPEAIAPLAVYLCSPAAAGITGQVLSCSSGTIGWFPVPAAARTIVTQGHWSIAELEVALPRHLGLGSA